MLITLQDSNMPMIFRPDTIRYSMVGKKRKKKKLAPSTAYKPVFKPYVPKEKSGLDRINEHRKDYPSMVGTSTGNLTPKEEPKVVEGVTLAPAYNKGAYQVIPRDEVKYIGK